MAVAGGGPRILVVAVRPVGDHLVVLHVDQHDAGGQRREGAGVGRCQPPPGRRANGRYEDAGERHAHPAAATCCQLLPRSPRRLERGGLIEDCLLKRLEMPAWFEPKFGTHARSPSSEGSERFDLPVGTVESKHQLLEQMLAVLMARDQLRELRNQRAVLAERELGVDPGLDGGQYDLVEPGGLVLGPLLAAEVLERLAAYEPECISQANGRLARRPIRRRVDCTLELPGVELGGLHPECVASCDRLDPVVIEEVAKLGDVRLDALPGRRRRGPVPDRVDEYVCRDGIAASDDEQREQRPLSRRSKRDRSLPIDDLERPENAELHASPVCGLPDATTAHL